MEAAIKSLLRQSGQIIAHQRELEEIRGEKFNVFSILSMETKEDATHSAFLGELLDPKGSHMMGPIFLEEFLKTIKHDSDFDASSATLTREFYIGKVDLENKTGGRIDILIKDKTGHTISIENKIYAGDQQFQIERYVNYNKSKNTVYYLTLSGDEPNHDSKGELSSKSDFHCLSFSNDIINWLEACQMQAVSKPVIRESIRQYILLLKKLTHQLSDNKMADKIIDLIENNYASARAVANAIEKAEVKAALLLLNEIKDNLENKPDRNWTTAIDDITTKWAGLTFKRNDIQDFWIKIEGYPHVHKTSNYTGMVATKPSAYESARDMIEKEVEYFSAFSKNKFWPCYIEIEAMDFSDDEMRESLFVQSKRTQIAKDVSVRVLELKDLIDSHFPI